MSDEPSLRDPPRVVAIAYLIAAACLLAPLALVGAVFAGIVLVKRDRPGTGVGVIALGLLCAALGAVVLR